MFGPTHLFSMHRELAEAYDWLNKFRVTRKEAELHQVGLGTEDIGTESRASLCLIL